jgi:phosphoribosylamine---glycine ligase
MATSKKYTVLIIGSGGREHTTTYLFQKSPAVGEIYVAPGNDGIFHGVNTDDDKLHRIDQRVDSEEDIAKMLKIAKDTKVDLVFVGPEQPLSLGIVDTFEDAGIPIVGPGKEASMLEGSKAWAKDVMSGLGISVPEYRNFDEPEKANTYVKSLDYPVVVKADGLAAGKGSLVTDTKDEAYAAIEQIMVKKQFGAAGDRVVIEKRLDGDEFSFFAFTDGKTVLPMAWARDYKRSHDNDEGLNTGGMGSYSPYRDEERLTDMVMKEIAKPLITGCREEHGFEYKGILYVGGTFMEEDGEIKPYVFEINVRMGDPEAQVIYPRLRTDIALISDAVANGTLHTIGELEWDPRYHVCICATSGRSHRKGKGNYPGYPRRYAIGKPITGLDTVDKDTLVFHSGTRWDNKNAEFVTAGGRVLSVVTSGNTLPEARKKAMSEILKIDFTGIHHRKDIGK